MRTKVFAIAAAMVVSAAVAAAAAWLIMDDDRAGDATGDLGSGATAIQRVVLDVGAQSLGCDAVTTDTDADWVDRRPASSSLGNTSFCTIRRGSVITIPQLVESEGEWIAVSYINGIEQKVRVNP